MTDADLLALCVLQEAAGEPDDGKAGVARVIQNRIAAKFFSDGTILGTVLRRDQFSWAWFAFEDGSYRRVCETEPEAVARAEFLLSYCNPILLSHCSSIAQQVMAGNYHGPDYDHLTDDAVLYLNPRIVHPLPAWAAPDKLICSIGKHDFYRK